MSLLAIPPFNPRSRGTNFAWVRHLMHHLASKGIYHFIWAEWTIEAPLPSSLRAPRKNIFSAFLCEAIPSLFEPWLIRAPSRVIGCRPLTGT